MKEILRLIDAIGVKSWEDRLFGKKGEASIAHGNTWAESEVKDDGDSTAENSTLQAKSTTSMDKGRS